MREVLSRKLLEKLEKHTPERILCLQYQVLLNMTARAFSVPGRWIWMHSAKQALQEYTRFSQSCMEKQAAQPKRLYTCAYRTGAMLHLLTGFSREDDITRLVFYLYRGIRIRMQGNIPGELCITSCSFSRYYTPRQCRIMSYMDSGLIAGLCGGGRLRFTQRITRNHKTCQACFSAHAGKNRQ